MKIKRVLLSLCLSPIFLYGQDIQSPDGLLKVILKSESEKTTYVVTYKNKTMLEESPLGLESTIGDFSTGLTFLSESKKQIEENYYLPNGKTSRIHYLANELTVSYLNKNKDTLQVLFRVSNNDIALAYRLASPKQTHCTIKRELTGFNFPAHTTTFITPQAPSGEGWMKTKPSYEEEYTNEEPIGTPSKYRLGYTFPALFHLGNTGWVLLSETGVTSRYAGTRLSEGNQEGLYTIAFPEKEENGGMGDNTVTSNLPLITSWKTITVGETLKPIVETTSAYNGMKPVYTASQPYKPGRSTWSWILWQDESCNYKDQQIFTQVSDLEIKPFERTLGVLQVVCHFL